MTTVDQFAGDGPFQDKTARGSTAGTAARSNQSTLQHLVFLIGFWIERSRQRRELAALRDYELRDIGLTRADAEREYGKPFWR
jgi:uncharacterized protein YjiS (DUF1127 family)